MLNALEQALHDHHPVRRGGLVHHSGGEANTFRSSILNVWLRPALSHPWAVVGDSYDNALAETINGLRQTEVAHRRGPWRSFAVNGRAYPAGAHRQSYGIVKVSTSNVIWI